MAFNGRYLDRLTLPSRLRYRLLLNHSFLLFSFFRPCDYSGRATHPTTLFFRFSQESLVIELRFLALKPLRSYCLSQFLALSVLTSLHRPFHGLFFLIILVMLLLYRLKFSRPHTFDCDIFHFIQRHISIILHIRIVEHYCRNEEIWVSLLFCGDVGNFLAAPHPIESVPVMDERVKAHGLLQTSINDQKAAILGSDFFDVNFTELFEIGKNVFSKFWLRFLQDQRPHNL